MNEMISPKGQCLCGAVKLELSEVKPEVGVCHCHMCRRWGGGSFMAINAGDRITINGEANVGIYKSSDWAERGFCKQCGTNLFYRLLKNNSYHVLAGLFDMDDPLTLDHEIFIDEKPNFYNFSEDTEKLTGKQVLEMFASTDDS